MKHLIEVLFIYSILYIQIYYDTKPLWLLNNKFIHKFSFYVVGKQNNTAHFQIE